MRTSSCPPGCPRWRDERGALLVHVAIAFTGLLAFSALSIDLGVLWAARAQAQNAADSAAMAAAVSLAYAGADEDYARAAASATAAAHEIWGEPAPEPAVAIGPCPTGSPSATGVCVQTTLERSDETGAPLPAYISRLFGFSTTSVRASASAKVLRGNASSCLKPIAIVDRWADSPPADDVFERYVPTPDGAPESILVGDPDVYEPPGPSGTGTGLAFANVGDTMLLQVPTSLASPTTASSLLLLDLPAASPSGDAVQDFRQNMANCPAATFSIDDTVQAGVHANLAAEAFQTIVAADPGAYWDPVNRRVAGSSSTSGLSPRIIAAAVFDPDLFRQANRQGQRAPLRIRNIVGLFVLPPAPPLVRVVLVPMPGNFDPEGSELAESASFLRTVALVR